MKISKETVDLIEKRKDALRSIIPEAFSDGKLDLDKLRQTLGEEIETGSERYSFTWAGKAQSIRLRDKRSKATLIPSRKESVEFDKTDNVFIEGDNLEVLKVLQKSYSGRVKMIYIDPPYNTGNDFVYKDDFSDSLKKYLKYTGQINSNGEKTSTNAETTGRYHSNWLSMIYPRLAVARNLLREDGVIFVSIDDNELPNLMLLMNEIFGEENKLDRGMMIWANRGSTKGFNKVVKNHEYIVAYGKNEELVKSAYGENYKGELGVVEHYCHNAPNPGNPTCEVTFKAGCKIEGVKNIIFEKRVGDEVQLKIVNGKMEFKDGKLAKDVLLRGSFPYRNQIEEFFENQPKGEPTFDYKGQRWLEIYFNSKGLPRYKKERNTMIISSLIDEKEIPNYGSNDIKDLLGQNFYLFPKPKELVQHLLKFFTKDNDIVLDFFAGSGTTAQAVLEQNLEDGGNRKFILVQLPEPTQEDSEARKSGYKNIADICKERIRRVIKKLKENGKQQKIEGDGKQDLGFKVFKLSKSNCFVWDEEAAKDKNTLAHHIQESANGPEHAEPETLLYEVALREGFPLDAKIEQVKHGKNAFYKIADGDHKLFACFDQKVDDEAVKKLQPEKDDKVVLLDSALTDTQKANLSRKMRIETI